MPHYSDGTEAKIGDLVRGVSHAGPREITGKVIQISKGPTCNLHVAHVDEKSPLMFNLGTAECENFPGNSQIGWGVMVVPTVSLGNADRFSKL